MKRIYSIFFCGRPRPLEKYPLRVIHQHDWNREFILLLPRLLHCPDIDQVLAMTVISQHWISSSKAISLCAPCGARCIRHAIKSWSLVFSRAPHSQFGEEARPHFCMDAWNRPASVRRRLSLSY